MSLNPDESPKDAPPSPPKSMPHAVSALVVVVLLVLVAAGAIGGTAAYYALRPSHSTGGPDTVVVVDDLGRTMTVPTDAARMVVLAPSIMDIIYRMGLRSHVVAVGCSPSISGGIYNEYSPNQTTLWTLSNASCITDYPSLNTEAIANDTPGVVLASTITSEAAVTTLTQTYHIPVVVLAPADIEGIVGDVRLVAQLFPSASSQAATLESQLSSALSAVSSMDANLSSQQAPVPSVLLTYYFDTGGYYSYGPGTFGASLIDLAGGTNLAAGSPLQYGEVNATVVLSSQPKVILYGTSWNDAYLVAGETPSVWATAPYWSQLNGEKVPLDVTLLSEPGPSMVLALPELQHLLYPSLVPSPP